MSLNETEKISFEVTAQLEQHMRFIGTMQQVCGVIMTIFGAISSLGIISAIVGIPIIIAGIKLFEAGGAINLTANTKKGEYLVDTLNNLYYCWKMIVILIIIFALILVLGGIALFVILTMQSHP